MSNKHIFKVEINGLEVVVTIYKINIILPISEIYILFIDWYLLLLSLVRCFHDENIIISYCISIHL